MKKELAIKLKERAEQVAKLFSRKDREFNHTGEKFEVHEIIPLSETTAAVIFLKSSSKKSLAFFYWLKNKGGWWNYFFPTDSHVLGLEKIKLLLTNIEMENYQFNFPNE